MRVAVPTMGSMGLKDQVSPHFGRAPTFTIIETDTWQVELVNNSSEHFGGMGKAPTIISEADSDALLCSGIGPRAIAMFEELGIRVYTGAVGSVEDSVRAFLQGNLSEATDKDACAEHHG